MIEPLGLVCTKRRLEGLERIEVTSRSRHAESGLRLRGQRGGKQQGTADRTAVKGMRMRPNMTGEWGGFSAAAPFPSR